MTDLEFKTRMRGVLEDVAVIAPNTANDEVAAESVIDLAMDSMLRLLESREREQSDLLKFMANPGSCYPPGELIGSAEPPPVRTGRVVYSGLEPKNDNELMDLKADWDSVRMDRGQ